MSYLFAYGKTGSAQMLSMVLEELGDIKLKAWVGKRVNQFFNKLSQLDKIEDERFFNWVCKKVKDEHIANSAHLPSPVNTLMANIIATELKILKKNREYNIKRLTSAEKRKEWVSKHLK